MIIVVGADGSDRSIVALRRAIQFADAWGAQLHVVHVMHIPSSLLGALSQVPTDLASLEQAQRQMVWNVIDPVIEGAPVDMERVDLDGYPADAIVEYAKKVKADLIVVGSRGRGELAALVLGSTSHRIVHISPCDVLVVKAPFE
ncbi:stress response protein NhaX [bacterium BMS3Abin02]|nr:stress response protein NhaX [bacterium BMS3Abin02]HDK46254.1 universal stress protein [Actinomycetota bacterium]